MFVSLQTLLLSLSSLTVMGKQHLNNGCNPLSSSETLSSPLFKSLSPSLSGHTPLLLIIKCRNTASCFIACATPEMINNPMSGDNLSCQCQAGGRGGNEMSNNNMTAAQCGRQPVRSSLHSPISSAAGALAATLETFCSPVAMETPKQRALSLKLTGADESCRWRKQGCGRKVNEKKTRVQGYFWLCAQDFKMLSLKRARKFLIFNLLLSQEDQLPI